jgi:hypothetical protein
MKNCGPKYGELGAAPLLMWSGSIPVFLYWRQMFVCNFTVVILLDGEELWYGPYESSVEVECPEEVSKERMEIVTKWLSGVVRNFLCGQFPTAVITASTQSHSNPNNPGIPAAVADTLAAAEADDLAKQAIYFRREVAERWVPHPN